MSEKKLIVTADDFGLTEGINKGIIDACRKGIVTRTSIMANGEAFEHAISLAKQIKTLKIGVHLTIVDETPTNPPYKIKSLVTSNGKLLNKYNFLTKYILRRISLNEVYTELESQIQKVLSAGININHIDSHQHLHMLPAIFKQTIDLANKYQINKIRIIQHNFAQIRCIKEFCLILLTKINKRNILHSNIDFTDKFLGLKESGNLKEMEILNLLDKIKSGSTEMMCHPGYRDEGYYNKYSQWTYHQEEELKALFSEKIIEKLINMNIKLVY